jgi:hypothetical protein
MEPERPPGVVSGSAFGEQQMAVQPDRDRREISDNPPLPGEIERERTDIRVVSLLGAVAILVAVGMWFYTKDREMIAGDGTTVQQTTGARSQDSGPEPRPLPRATTTKPPAPSSNQ